jgi:hypothetical protein
MALLIIAGGLCRLPAPRVRGYAGGQARQVFRDLANGLGAIPAERFLALVRRQALRLTTYTA